MKLVVGLGNPGARYRQTRHNVGYLILSEFVSRYSGCSPKSKFHGDFVDIRGKNGETIFLLCPTTYMNLSGKSVIEAVRFYKIPLDNVLIVCDDLNLPFAKLRFRGEGSSGGQKGLADILRVLGTDKVPRLRFGIGEAPARIDAADYVLMNFTESERPELLIALKESADAVQHWIDHGIANAMNKYNGKS
ncbi:MAG: aminoacyl-tRNA hydrolase [Planctomycetaceae bacterium]|jgi:PTH1 family peptidyl-tRNA hydrolase|nr:aminoacyl-tRNA hydrolase [Planctomycetaceae bacterium]